MYRKLSGKPFGKRIFSRIASGRAPYFKSIAPVVINLERNAAEVLLTKRKAVENHIGTVHVIAICNGLELAMGLMAEASIPKHLRWIPKGMALNYTGKATSDIHCFASVKEDSWQPGDLDIEVIARREDGESVVEGVITLWISEKP